MDTILILKEVFCKFPPLAHLVHLRKIAEVNRERLGGTAVWDSILRAMAPSDAFVCRFTLNTVDLAGKFDGTNWHELTSTLTADILKATQQKISLRDLAAMRLLDTIKVVGQRHADWQALHRTLLDLNRAQYTKLSGQPDKLATILDRGGVLQKRLDTGEGSVIPLEGEGTAARKAFVIRSGLKSPAFGCSGCVHHCKYPDGHWRPLTTASTARAPEPTRLASGDSDAIFKANSAVLLEAAERGAARAALSAEVPQHVKDANYHAYLSASAAHYDPEEDQREFGYEDRDGTWHPVTPSTRQRYYKP